MSSSTTRYWLLKAEPDSRIVKGKDVKFSVEDFECVGTSPWEGVRNYEARNLMKEMKKGEMALFYHSNCKIPGIAAFAEVSKAAYPDYTAWDASHPYYDPKSKSEDPRWFMVDLTFKSRAPNFVPLVLLRTIASLSPSHIPSEIAYLGEDGVNAIKGMDLVARGRLSVQRVEEVAWKAIGQLAEKGGWEEMVTTLKKKAKGKEADAEDGALDVKPSAARKRKVSRSKKKAQEGGEEDEEESTEQHVKSKKPSGKTAITKRKRDVEGLEETGGRDGLRRSTRARK
ncbi:PUA-like domain-containing protein [Flammula alnicola]|nr:PUA-like domain-containing protein [Flammula alnicola]